MFQLLFFSDYRYGKSSSFALDFCGFQWVEPMADAGADQYTFHLEATSDDEVEGLCRKVRKFYTFDLSVADRDPDSYVFGPPGFGSISTWYGSGSFYRQAK